MIKTNAAGEHCVHKKMMDGSAGAKVTCHATAEEAKKHMAALYANEGKSLFSDALRQTERRTWELWDAVRTATSEIANAKRSEKVTGTKVDVAKKVDELISDYAAELKPTIVEQINEYADSDTTEPFYLKAQTMDKLLQLMQSRYGSQPPVRQTMPGSDTLTFHGGAVKALGGGKIGGYLVLFSTAEDPDLQGDYFTKGTDLYIDSGETRPIFYRHGAHPVIKSRRLGKAKLTIDDVGVFVEGELELRDKYEKAIYGLAEQGKLGWSSGSMSHLVSKTANGKSFEIVSWPISEASLTPAPVEGRTAAIPLKEITIDNDELDFDSFVKEVEQSQYDEQFSIDGIPSIKHFCEAVSPTSMKNAMERSKAAADATKEFITVGKLLGEGFYSYASRLVTRSENRFLKEGREIDPATVQQANQLLGDIGRIERAFGSVRDSVQGIVKISELTIAEQKALDERARLELWNFCRISGTAPEELSV